ncbi:MAG TPA: hypothetical protein ENI05_13320, partial [Porticoccus sp.]|nr:hypothetical protein [Porticoccus sp.]
YDKGYCHITTRQNIQFNWPQLEEVPDVGYRGHSGDAGEETRLRLVLQPSNGLFGRETVQRVPR